MKMGMAEKKHQGHFCRVCQRYRANEKFGGHRHAQHICKDCQREQKHQRRLKRQQIPSESTSAASEGIDETGLHRLA